MGESGQYGSGREKQKLWWSIALDNDDKEKLLKGEEVEKKASVGLERNNGLNLWPREKAGIVVKANEHGKMLMVTYTQWVERLMNLLEGKRTGGYVDSTLTCNWSELIKSNRGIIYQGGTVRNERDNDYKQVQETPLVIKVSLRKGCGWGKVKKELICDLKVTDRDNLKVCFT